MNNKVIAIVAVAILVVAGIAVVILMTNNNGGGDGPKATLSHRLTVIGNAFSDDTIDENDVKVIQAVIDGKNSITVAGNVIDLTDEDVRAYCDADNNSKIDSADIDFVRELIDGKAKLAYYVNANNEVKSANLPINNIVVMFRRIGTTIAMLGASEMVVGYENNLRSGGSYGFLNFPGQAVGSQSDPDDELIITMNKNYASTGGVTVIADATGSDPNMENDLRGIDVIRLPVTELGKSENGVVTLGYLLSFSEKNGGKVQEALDKWISWNDSVKDKVDAALAKLSGDKKTCLVGLYYNGSYNCRVKGVSEFEYTEMCGANNIADDVGIIGGSNSFTMSELNEILLAHKPQYLMVMQSETLLLNNTESMDVTCKAFKEQLSSNFDGEVVMFSQFVGTGPGYALSLMVYANNFLPLDQKFDVQSEYETFMGTMVGNTTLSKLPITVTA